MAISWSGARDLTSDPPHSLRSHLSPNRLLKVKLKFCDVFAVFPILCTVENAIVRATLVLASGSLKHLPIMPVSIQNIPI